MINKENKGKAEELQQLRVNKYNESVEENYNCVPLLSKNVVPFMSFSLLLSLIVKPANTIMNIARMFNRKTNMKKCL